MSLRSHLRGLLYTPNTIRYRIEWRCIRDAWRLIGKQGRLFDGGAGSGEFARKALDEGFCEHVTALEFDEGNFHLLGQNLGCDPRAEIRRGSILDIPFASGSFDVAECTQVLEHIVEHERAAAELVRALRPGGFAIITVPHPPEPFSNEGHVREGYTEDDLKNLFCPLGMEPVHTDWFLTSDTIEWMMLAGKMPLNGVYLPLALVDAEAGMSLAERKARKPFGILMLFQKAEQAASLHSEAETEVQASGLQPDHCGQPGRLPRSR